MLRVGLCEFVDRIALLAAESSLWILCVSVVGVLRSEFTAEAQKTQGTHAVKRRPVGLADVPLV
jgi:hypothetical protein